jgi:sulfur relay (sulfurtransferase) complex TusBCD TusD component (DsrE family)
VSVLVEVSTAPYGSEGPYNALRLAGALNLRDEHGEISLIGGAVHATRAGQDPRGAHHSLELMLMPLLTAGMECVCCGTSCAARGLTESDLVADVRLATIHDPASAVARCDKVVSF